jgi:hypothetical protein
MPTSNSLNSFTSIKHTILKRPFPHQSHRRIAFGIRQTLTCDQHFCHVQIRHRLCQIALFCYKLHKIKYMSENAR